MGETHEQTDKRYVVEGIIKDEGLNCHTYDVYQRLNLVAQAPYGYGVNGFLGIHEGKKVRITIEILE